MSSTGSESTNLKLDIALPCTGMCGLNKTLSNLDFVSVKYGKIFIKAIPFVYLLFQLNALSSPHFPLIAFIFNASQKRTSTSETPAITLDAIRQLIADFTTALEAQTAAMASTSNPNCIIIFVFMNHTITPKMPPKRTSTSETPAITLDAIRQLIADFTTALEAQTAAMAKKLAVLCPNMVSNAEKLVEVFISGLPRSIEGNVTASKPQTLGGEAYQHSHMIKGSDNKAFLF
ncbi:hypothetical protein Tco_0204623 [Tanacetum coccineum]